MKILVICPMQSETEYFKAARSKFQELKHEYVAYCAGVGKANSAATTALSLYSPDPAFKQFDLIAVIGYAAASSYYQQGDFVMPTKALYHDAVCPAGVVEDLERVYELEGNDECTILTGDTFISKEIAKALIEKHGDKVLFDMEATAVAQIAYDLDIPVLVMKFVSDVPDLDHDNLQSFEEFVNTHTDFTPFISYLESLE